MEDNIIVRGARGEFDAMENKPAMMKPRLNEGSFKTGNGMLASDSYLVRRNEGEFDKFEMPAKRGAKKIKK